MEAARTAFGSALRWEPLETDLLSVAMVVERALSDQASAEVIDEQLLDRCAELLLRQEQAGAFVLRSFLSWCFFHEFDAEFEKGRRPDSLEVLLKALEGALGVRPKGDTYWAAEISLRRASIAEAKEQETFLIVRHLRSALKEARKAETVES